MALLDIFSKRLKGENKYFSQRQGDEKPDENGVQEEVREKYVLSEKLINKGLLADLFKIMRSHDVAGSVAILANTTDNSVRQAGMMINKGYIPKKIVTYLQNIGIYEIEDALKIVKTNDPDQNGFYPIDERTAARLNLPLGCMLYGAIHHIKKEFGLIMVLKTSLKDKKEFAKKVQKTLKR